MGRFDEFELTIKKINDYPLTYETFIPQECNFFQDVRRYKSVGVHLDVRVIKVDGRIQLDPDMERIPIGKLTAPEKKELIDYLTVRVARGDNIGYGWAFFRSREKKKPVVAYGANVVHKDTAFGQDRVRLLLGHLQKTKVSSRLQKRWLGRFAIAAFILTALFLGYKYGHLAKRFPFKSLDKATDTSEMQFYEDVFPDVYAWYGDDESPRQGLARELLKPEFVSDMLTSMAHKFHRKEDARDRYQGQRLILFVYFNYNNEVARVISENPTAFNGTEFMRLARIYSTKQSGYASNIFYFKVGDLDIKHAEISRFMKQNYISYRDFKKIRDANTFSEIMEKDSISFKMKSFLEDVYTFTPLRIERPMEGREWYLLTRKGDADDLAFAAFFHEGSATLVPKRIGDLLLDESPGEDISWYALTPEQADSLKLSGNALTYFTKTTGQALKLEIIRQKIRSLHLSPVSGYLPVIVHRELLMGDTKGKYGIQTYDPLTSLVLSNLITKNSFERDNNLSLKRDPIQVNTTLVQLSKDDSFSVQTVTITPGTTGIIRLFEPRDRFNAVFANGEKAVFEKATVNLFNPFTFYISNDSITFSFRNDITDMKVDLGNQHLKIVKASDGNHQIIETF